MPSEKVARGGVVLSLSLDLSGTGRMAMLALAKLSSASL